MYFCFLAGEIKELCGCDLLTISPKLLAELQDSSAVMARKLSPETGESRTVLWVGKFFSSTKIVLC